MKKIIHLLGSLKIAVVLLVAIATVLAWGTIYETLYGTASVQRYIYASWWFELILAFLGINLAIAAAERYPWQKKHIPFVSAHIGIIMILVGGILGGRFGVDGQLIVPEQAVERLVRLPGRLLTVRAPDFGINAQYPTRFETRAWDQEPDYSIPLTLGEKTAELRVDRYFPDATVSETIVEGLPRHGPGVHIQLDHGLSMDSFWMLADDRSRFAMGWGESHVLLLAPKTQDQLEALLAPAANDPNSRGTVHIELRQMDREITLAVPVEMNTVVPIEGTPYTVSFRDYFPDFIIGESGPASRSDMPNNPAVSFLLEGPEGSDAYLLFAQYPDFQEMHGVTHVIDAHAAYTFATGRALPPNTIAIIHEPGGGLSALLTSAEGKREHLSELQVGERYMHPWLQYGFQVSRYLSHAVAHQEVVNRSDQVGREAVHVVLSDGENESDAWIGIGQGMDLVLDGKKVTIEYAFETWPLPFMIRLIDFRKMDYPGTRMAAAFESDVELIDSDEGLRLLKRISMNNPLRYKGYSLFQSSYIEGRVNTTVLSVRKDPGIPLIYLGSIIMTFGIIAMFVMRSDWYRRRNRENKSAKKAGDQ